MTKTRMGEAALNASLDACLHDARSGDTRQARRLHELLDHMLTEREGPEGRFWLTDHGRMVLAEMHRSLSHCPHSDDKIAEAALDAVHILPKPGHWPDQGSFVKDLRVAISVANELCEQRDLEGGPDIAAAVDRVVQRGEFELDASQIRNIYEEVAGAIGGFHEISAH